MIFINEKNPNLIRSMY